MKFSEIKKPYFIAEIGINHNGDMQIAKKLIDAAHGCSWDCVKFQKRNPDVCVPEDQKSVERQTPWGKMTYLEYKYRMEFGKKEYDYIDQYCREKPIALTASAWDMESLKFILNYNVPFIKIPSAHLVHDELLAVAAKSGISIILSTGMSSLEEIDHAVDIFRQHDTEFLLMHVNSSYPTPIDELNVNCVRTLKERYGCEVGYSGHEYGLEPTVFAAVLGVKIIERHITLDHEMWGTDQKASLAPMGMDMLYKRIRDVDRILGDGKKCVTKSEIPIREKLRG